jgi:segregation and condensation protein A
VEELERRLKEYEQFKTGAQLLAELHALQHRHFGRSRGETPDGAGETEGAEEPFEVGITDLMSAFAKVLEKATAPVYEVKAEPWTVEMKVQDLRVLLTVRRSVTFLELFTPEKSKLELVVTFLALLELMRQRVARAVQERQFADIHIVWREAAAA